MKLKNIAIWSLGSLSIILVLFDLSNAMSFANVPKWYQDIKNYMKNNQALKGYLIGNKNDIPDKREVSDEEIKEFAKKQDMVYFETSAKSGSNINDIFSKIAQQILILFEKREAEN